MINQTTNINRILALITSVVWLSFAVYLAQMAFVNFTTKPLVLKFYEAKSNVTVVAGDTISVEVISKESQRCSVSFDRYIQKKSDNHVIVVQEGSFNTEARKELRYIDLDILVPKSTLPGDYRFFTQYRFYCNIMDYVIPRLYDGEGFDFKVVKGHA